MNHRVNMAWKINRRTNNEVTRRPLRCVIRIARETADRVKEHWFAWCASFDFVTPISFLWQKIRSVDRRAVLRPALLPQPYENIERLAELFASRLHGVTSPCSAAEVTEGEPRKMADVSGIMPLVPSRGRQHRAV